MKYIGKLYGKVGGMYFDTGKTSYDWDDLEERSMPSPIGKICPKCGSDNIVRYMAFSNQLNKYWNECSACRCNFNVREIIK